MKTFFGKICGALLVTCLSISALQAATQTLTILGGNGNAGDQSEYTEFTKDDGQTWQKAYLTGSHPWGYVEGTNSWINFDPDDTVGLNTSTDYRIRFNLPEDYTNASMNFQINADNRAHLALNATEIGTVEGSGSGLASQETLNSLLRPGLNEITLTLVDWGGLVGLNFRIDLIFEAEEAAILYKAGEIVPPTINWTSWQSENDTNGTTVYGQITTPTATVDVVYNNPQGIAGTQLNGSGTDYYRTHLPDETSPYTNDKVANPPSSPDIIRLYLAGNQSLSFSEPVANLVFAYVSLNGNGYAFDQDFEVLSYGDSQDGNDCGYWGCGTSYKNVVDLGNGQFEYQLLGTGEPHGTIRFLGSFDELNWKSMSYENWNGFTVGVQGVAAEVKTDDDGDGVLDVNDNCPAASNADQLDIDQDGLGDVCDPFNDTPTDTDGDGVPDEEDAFPNDPSETTDTDGDGVGNNADAFPNDSTETIDTDGDGVGNNADAFPNDATETTDTDGDGVGNNADVNDQSDLSVTVVIAGNDSGVANETFENGETLADRINNGFSTCSTSTRNHGQLVSCMAKFHNSLLASDIINDEEKSLLQSAVAESKEKTDSSNKGKGKGK